MTYQSGRINRKSGIYMQITICWAGGQLWQVNVRIADFMTGRIARYTGRERIIQPARIG